MSSDSNKGSELIHEVIEDLKESIPNAVPTEIEVSLLDLEKESSENSYVKPGTPRTTF